MLSVLVALTLSTSPHTGTLKKELIDNALQAQFPKLEACLETSHAKAEGRVVAHVVFARDGRVRTARLSEATTASPAAARCVLSTVKAMKTPPPMGGTVEVTLPFDFETRGR